MGYQELLLTAAAANFRKRSMKPQWSPPSLNGEAARYWLSEALT
jgi:hypothetical protein